MVEEVKEWWKDNKNIKEELNDAPLIVNATNNIKNSQWFALHEELSKKVIDFFKEHGLPTDSYAISFYFDDLKSSVDFGEWHPSSDSSLRLVNTNNKEILLSM